MPIPSCTDDHGRLIPIKRRKKPTILVFLRTQDMRGTQEKIGLLAAVTSEYRGTQHSSENGSAAPFKSRPFFARFSV
jgi:hypothetical protein